MKLNQLTIRNKMLLQATIFFFFLLSIGAASLYAINNLSNELIRVHKTELQQARLINAARTYVRAIEGSMIQLLLADNTSETQTSLRQEIAAYEAKRQELFGRIDATEMNEGEKALYQQAKQASVEARNAREAALQLLDNGNKATAWQIYQSQAQDKIDQSNQLLRQLSETADACAAQSAQRGTELSRFLLISVGILSVSALLIGSLCVYLISRSITTPLSKLNSQAHSIAAGDLSGQTLPIVGSDEIAQLTNSFNQMILHLRELVAGSQDSAKQTAAAAEELTASSEQCADAATQITNSITKVADASARQQAHVETTSAAIQQISANIQQIAATAESFSLASNQTAVSASEGETTIHQAVGQMQSVAEETSLVQSKMNDLNESSHKIADIVNLITSIADQTNLLALNAAIEAARAGEQGRGFAVVAEEVRKLAEDSSKAAHHIGELVKTNETQVAQVNTSTQLAAQALQTGLQTVEQAGLQFNTIASAVSNLAKEMRDISQSVEEVAKGTQDIVNSSSRINTETHQVASEIQQISAAMEEQTASLEEVSSAGEGLAHTAETMLKRITAFHL